ncbi:hypothetical protein [Streptomyces anulatus]|uniref:hypothetical protein n=1 Tax=Streptomyces anulatus TaxID=1892 RepID=UPI0004C8F7B1
MSSTTSGLLVSSRSSSRPGSPDADLYQMLAYCTALGLPDGHLVYARGYEPSVTHRVRHAGIRIHQHALALDCPPGELLAEIAVIARSMAGGTGDAPVRRGPQAAREPRW